MSITLYLSFLFSSFVLALLPGPDNLYVLAESITNGARHGILITVGLVSGVLVHTLLAAIGVSGLMYSNDVVFVSFKLICTLYFIWLALGALKEPGTIQIQSTVRQSANSLNLIRKGFIMNVTNPKVGMFFLAFLPQYVDPNGVHPMLQMSLMGFTFIFAAFLIFSIIALLGEQLRPWLNKPAIEMSIKVIKISVLLFIAAGLWINESAS